MLQTVLHSMFPVDETVQKRGPYRSSSYTGPSSSDKE